MLVFHAEFEVAAKLDVGAAPGHVGGDGDGALPARLGDDVGLHLVEARIQDVVLDPFLLEEFGQQLALLDRYRADQHRLAEVGLLLDRLGDRAELVERVLVELVLLVDPQHRHVGRDRDDVHLVDVEEFRGFGRRRAGHAGELGIHAEIVLEGDRGHGLVLGLDLDAFLGLDRLVEAVRPAPAFHHPAGELVDDDDLAVLDDVVGIALEHDHALERLVEVVDHLGVLDIVEVGAEQQAGRFEDALGLFDPVLGQHDVLGLLVLLVVLGIELLHDGVDREVELALVVGRAGNDQRRARLVDQDRIDLVDDGVVERAVHHLPALVLHVVAQVIEAEFVVGRVGDVGKIGFAALVLVEVGHDHPDGEPEEAVDLPHPVGIAPGEVIVDRDDMHALAFERVEIDRQRRHQGLALAGLHLGDLAAMEHDAADHLHVEMAHAERALRCLADGGECLGQKVVQRLATVETAAEPGGLARQFGVVHRLDSRLHGIDLLDDLVERFDVTVVRRAKNGFRDCPDHFGILKSVGKCVGA